MKTLGPVVFSTLAGPTVSDIAQVPW